MAIRYQIVARPTDGVRVADSIIGADGIGGKSVVVANGVAVPIGNYATVLQDLVNRTVQPNTNQTLGLIAYMAAIEGAVDTSALEDLLEIS